MKRRKTPVSVVLKNKFSELKRRMNASYRMTPSFVIIGTARGGTTSLFNYLSLHPQIEIPVKKEIAYFCTHFDKGLSWYKSHFPVKSDPVVITGEASPYYLSHPKAAQRMKSVFPDIKIILLLRNPVERAFSSYKNIKKIGLEPSENFEKAVSLEEERTKGEEEKIISNDHYYSHQHQHYSYLRRSIYHTELESWYREFPTHQFLIINSEAFYANPGETYKQTISFLGLPDHDPGQLDPFNESIRGEQIDPQFREKLVLFFESHNEKLFKLINKRYIWK